MPKGDDTFNVKYHRYTCLIALIGVGMINPIILLGAWLGSALPDADTPHSRIGSIFPLWWVTGRNSHRKYTHSIYAMIAATVLFALINWRLAVGVGIGWGFHLFADYTTKVGLPYGFWPYRYNSKHWYFTEEHPYLLEEMKPEEETT